MDTLAGPGPRSSLCASTPTALSVEQAGVLLGISRRSAYRAAAAGHIPTIRLGRRILVPAARLYDMLGLDRDASIDTSRADGHSQSAPQDP
jgi:excisionase family DNA binding protein